MAKPRTIGNKIAPARFLLFAMVLAIAYPVAANLLHDWALGAMAAFDAAAVVFLLSAISLLGTREAHAIREHAQSNDANRILLLVVTGIVIAVLLTAIAVESVGEKPPPLTKALIIVTLALAWLFSNLVFALHYAHLVYMHPDAGRVGLEFPRTPHPVYWDFIYFAFTCGMAFSTSDVQITETHMRRTVTIHCVGAFVFNIGVLAFSIGVLGSG